MLMMWLFIIHFLSAVILVCSDSRRISNAISIAANLLTFTCALMLAWQVNKQGTVTFGNEWFYVDYLSSFLIVITTFIGLTTAIFSATFLLNEQRAHKLTRKNIRFYYSLYQFFFFAALLILVTNNLGILWVAMECATLCTVLLIGLYHIPQSLEAAWKYLILCGLGLAQALLGTILLYFAARTLQLPSRVETGLTAGKFCKAADFGVSALDRPKTRNQLCRGAKCIGTTVVFLSSRQSEAFAECRREDPTAGAACPSLESEPGWFGPGPIGLRRNRCPFRRRGNESTRSPLALPCRRFRHPAAVHRP